MSLQEILNQFVGSGNTAEVPGGGGGRGLRDTPGKLSNGLPGGLAGGAAAKADGHIDAREQERIFQTVDEMALSDELKAQVFDYLRQPVTVEELALEVTTLEQKSEVYLAACMVTRIDHPAERAYLHALGYALQLPRGLAQQLDAQSQQAAVG